MGSRPSRVIFILFFLLVGGWTVIYRPPALKQGPKETDLAAFDSRESFTDDWRRFHRARLNEQRADNLSNVDVQRAREKYKSSINCYRRLARRHSDSSNRPQFFSYVFNRSLDRVKEKEESLSTN